MDDEMDFFQKALPTSSLDRARRNDQEKTALKIVLNKEREREALQKDKKDLQNEIIRLKDLLKSLEQDLLIDPKKRKTIELKIMGIKNGISVREEKLKSKFNSKNKSKKKSKYKKKWMNQSRKSH